MLIYLAWTHIRSGGGRGKSTSKKPGERALETAWQRHPVFTFPMNASKVAASTQPSFPSVWFPVLTEGRGTRTEGQPFGSSVLGGDNLLAAITNFFSSFPPSLRPRASRGKGTQAAEWLICGPQHTGASAGGDRVGRTLLPPI